MEGVQRSLKKRWKAAAAGLIFAIGSVTVSMADETAQQKAETDWQWVEDSAGWRYENVQGEYKKNCWESIDGFWYYFNRDGYMASDWTRIGGVNYCFSETGELLLGWRYEEENEKWYYFDEDGTAKKGWYQDEDGSWYWFSQKGEMAASGYKTIEGKRYYFFDNGQMAANQYVGLNYMDENGQRNRECDIVIEGRKNASTVSSEKREAFTEALKNIPREWIKRFNDQGWQILYYPNKTYFSAPLSGGSPYYVCHKLDTSYRKLKVCSPEALTEAFGEYIGYAAGLYENDSEEARDLFMNRGLLDPFVDVPDYYADDTKFFFGKLVEAYLGSSTIKAELEEWAPEAAEILKRVLY